MPSSFTVRTTRESDWPEVRKIRLEMLADTPIAFSETVQTAAILDEAEWRRRAGRGEGVRCTTVVAIDDTSGRWIGSMGGFVPDRNTGGPLLVGVWVHPEFRGRTFAVADVLLDAIEDWARDRGDSLTLYVHERNAPAMAFYRRRGFTLTGAAHPYNLDPSCIELEMRHAL